MTIDITPFTAAIPSSVLEDLKQRLEHVRWPEKETCEDWSQGIPLQYTQELAQYWATDYDWRRFEKKLNSWTQYIKNKK